MRRLAPIWLVLLLAAAARAGEILRLEFQDRQYTFPNRVHALAIEDVDGDGLRDLVAVCLDPDVASETPRRFSVVRQGPDGFPEAAPFSWEADHRTIAFFLADVDDSPGREILFLAADGVYVYPHAGREGTTPRAEKVLDAEVFFSSAQANDLPFWLEPFDADGNGRDDLLLPVSGGYLVCLQDAPGTFPHRFLLPMKEKVSAASRFPTAGLKPTYSFRFHKALPRPLVVDLNGDGRLDVAAIEEDVFVAFLQRADGSFPAEADVRNRMKFLTDLARRDTVDVTLLQLEDIDADRRWDLLVTHIHGDLGLFESLETALYFFRGRDEGFAATPDQVIRITGVSVPPSFADLDGNGKRDLVISSLRTDLMSNLGTALLDRFKITYYLYLFDDGAFSRRPSYTRTVSVATDAVSKGGAQVPHAYFSSDFDGDGRRDLLSITGKGVLALYRGRKTAGLFHASEIDFGKDEMFEADVQHAKEVYLEDLNGDGRGDIVLRYSDRLRVLLQK